MDVRAVDVRISDWDCSLEVARPVTAVAQADERDRAQAAIRLGLRMIKGLSRAGADRIVAARREMRI